MHEYIHLWPCKYVLNTPDACPTETLIKLIREGNSKKLLMYMPKMAAGRALYSVQGPGPMII